MTLSFSISLTASQLPLMNAVKYYLISNYLDIAHLKSRLPDDYEDMIINRIVLMYFKKARGKEDKPLRQLFIIQVKFIVEKFIPMLSDFCFVTKKFKDFQDWAFIASLIYTGKHTTEAGKELIIKISKGMNNSRLSTFKGKDKIEEIPQKLIDEVISMKDVYVKRSDGLRVKASDGTLFSGQLFYILASGSNGENLVFKNSELCVNYFGVTSATINNRIVKELPIVNDRKIEFMLFRKPI